MDELQKIKDKYGEQMMHFCRKEFPTILETPDLLFSILFSRFDYNKELYNDLKNSNLLGDFREYIFSEAHFESSQVETDKTPQELLKEAGYILYECKTKKDIDFFKKYFAKKESICTFRTNRLETSYVFFAVKENVKDIKRENFPNPKRQDEYGTSVISIQFYRGNVNSVKITNRYNHTVDNPDATFSNNLDNIIPGLTYAFEKQYGFKIDRYGEKRLIIPGYVQSSNLRFYRYNHKAGSTFFCPNNKIIFNSSEIKDYKEKERFLFADAYIFDLQRKKLIACNKEIEKDNKLRQEKEKQTRVRLNCL